MRAILILILLSTAAFAQTEASLVFDPTPLSNERMSFVRSQYKPAISTCFAKIPDLAMRLGVAPVKEKSPTIIITGCNGKDYDLIEMLTALVDKMDEASKK